MVPGSAGFREAGAQAPRDSGGVPRLGPLIATVRPPPCLGEVGEMGRYPRAGALSSRQPLALGPRDGGYASRQCRGCMLA